METNKARPAETGDSFEVRTANVDYFVCEGDQDESLGNWQAAIRQALMPVHVQPPQPQLPAGAEAAEANGEDPDSTEVSVRCCPLS